MKKIFLKISYRTGTKGAMVAPGVFKIATPTSGDTAAVLVLNHIPTGFYPEKIFQITEIFDADISNAGVESNATGVNTNAYLGVNSNTLTTIQFADDANLTQDYNDLQFRITFDTNNPQNLTTGSITIKTLILKYPI